MDLQTAVDNFDRAMKHCDNIVAVHQGYGGGGVGRRYQEVSLDRAVVVLAVAAWQAAVQDMTTALLDTASPSSGAAIDKARYEAVIGGVRKAIGEFATPNAENTRRLMVSAGFDPRSSWTWNVGAGHHHAAVHWSPTEADKRLNEWLKIRHAIAHGHDELPIVNALESVRVDGVTVNPTIRLKDARDSIAFVSRLVRLTAIAAAAHLGITVTIPR